MAQGGAKHILVVNSVIRKAIKAEAGDQVDIRLEKDADDRDVSVPDDLTAALLDNDEGRHFFEQMSYSSRKEYCDWIESVKKAETRSALIEKAVAKLSLGQRLK